MLLLGFLLIAQSAVRSTALPDVPQSLLMEQLRHNRPRLIDPPLPPPPPPPPCPPPGYPRDPRLPCGR
jgi:hypothetical protein